MKMRTLVLSVLIAGGTVLGVAGHADAATKPRVGAPCLLSEEGKFRTAPGGQTVRCTNTGYSGMKWVRVAQR
ncbi:MULTISPECIES: hypothetical protein [unclassified Gordonia (in: high G+C Gram-positive bacteria)]|uniref:hypothetical protein n=1 Tax=unclassified Gordonia (in: high G+C Gram-positive bacteria) TaxID=2657482 RepID=UPI001F0F336D|nr:hypothetical protein [Gordonia sp. ABSL49_1]MCH5641452.1 hypothetical protein [Gordonia sp. ABSL49_1]